LFSAVISVQFSINRMIISVVAAKIWCLKNVRFLLGHPVEIFELFCAQTNKQTNIRTKDNAVVADKFLIIIR